jgi:hypothetical protein
MVKSVRIESPEVHVLRRRDGGINLLALAPAEAAQDKKPPGEPAKPFAYRVDEIALVDGRVHIADEVPANPYRVRLERLSFAAQGLSNAPNAKAPVKVGFDTDAKGRFAFDGSVALTPVQAEGKVDLAGFRLGAFYPYYESALNLEVADGTLDLNTGVALGVDGKRFDARLEGLSAAIKSLRLLYPGDREPLWQIPLIELKETMVDVGKQTVSVGQAVARDAVGHVRRNGDGTTHYARLIKPTPARAEAPPQSGQTEWRVDAKRLALENVAVTLDDRAPAKPVVTRLTQISAVIEEFSNAKGAKAKAALQARVNKRGTIALSGPLTLAPVAADLRVEAKSLELAPFQPYIDEHANVLLTSGAVSTRGNLSLDVPERKPARLAYRGNINLADFAALDKPTSQELLKWKSLYVGGIDFNLEPLKVGVGEVALSDFYSRLIVNSDGTLNLQGLLRTSDTATQASPAPPAVAPATKSGPSGAAPAGLPPNVRIGKITLQGGNVNFSDFFVKPNYSANLTGLGGSVTEMTREKPGDVELRGRIDQTAPLEIAGQVNALAQDLFVDLKASAKDIELSPFSPYAIKYAGYGIEKGKLSVNVKYLVEARKLTAENNVYLDQLTFGEKVESPTATKLPVLLAVSLLKDRNGVIDVNLPISGSLDDPQFSLGGVIIRVIVNLIVKAATAPFALLGAMFGGGEEMAYIEFAPGASRLDQAAEEKLKALAKALNDRPNLKVDASGRVVPEADREGLRRQAVERQVKAQKLKAAPKESGAPKSLDEVEVDPAEYPKYLTAAYREAKFPKPRNVVGLAKDLPVPEMETLMLTHAEASDEDLRQLANARAQATKDWLVEEGKISADRVFLVAPKLDAEGVKDKGKPTRVDLSLK